MKDLGTLTAGTGTFQWMVPEAIIGRNYDEKSDIYPLSTNRLWEGLDIDKLNISSSVAMIDTRRSFN